MRLSRAALNAALINVVTMLALVISPAWAQESSEVAPLTSAVSASLAISVAAQALVRPLEPREPALLTLTLVDRVSGQPGRLGEARALIRPMTDGGEHCRDLTHRLRATGMAASGDYPLNGSLLLTISADGHAALIDPLLPASRNTLAVRPLPLTDPRLIGDPGSNLFAVQDGTHGKTLRVEMPDLALTPVETAPGDYVHLDSAGLVAVGRDRLTRLGSAQRTRAMPLPEGDWRLERAGATALFVDSRGTGRLVVPRSRAERFRAFTLPSTAMALTATFDGSLAAYATDATLHLVNTATGQFSSLSVGRSPRAAHFTPDGGIVLVVLDDGLTIAAVDASTARLGSAITLQYPLGDIAMTDSDGFLQLANAALYRFPLPALRRGEGILLSPVAEAQPGQRDRRAPWLPALAPLAQGEGILASNFAADSIARVETAGHAAFNAPQSPPTPIRAGSVKAFVAVARGFAEIGPGRYTAPFVARNEGPHVLVLADRLGKISTCAAFQVGRMAAVARPRTLRLQFGVGPSGFAPGEVTQLSLAADTPLPPDAPEELWFEVMDLASPWRVRAVARKVEGIYRLGLRFPHPGHFIAQPLAAPPYNGAVAIRLPADGAVRP